MDIPTDLRQASLYPTLHNLPTMPRQSFHISRLDVLKSMYQLSKYSDLIPNDLESLLNFRMSKPFLGVRILHLSFVYIYCFHCYLLCASILFRSWHQIYHATQSTSFRSISLHAVEIDHGNMGKKTGNSLGKPHSSWLIVIYNIFPGSSPQISLDSSASSRSNTPKLDSDTSI